MSTAPALASIVLPLGGRCDLRKYRRYPVSLDLSYRLLQPGGATARVGTGRTRDISNGGLCFECEDAFPSSGVIELSLNWPCALEGIHPLKLVMRGSIVRATGGRIAVKALGYEFRTAGIRPMHAHPPSAKRHFLLG